MEPEDPLKPLFASLQEEEQGAATCWPVCSIGSWASASSGGSPAAFLMLSRDAREDASWWKPDSNHRPFNVHAKWRSFWAEVAWAAHASVTGNRNSNTTVSHCF